MQPDNTSPFASPAYHDNPYQFYAQWRAVAPVQATTLPDGTAAFVVSRYAEVERILKDPRFVKNIHNARDGEDHPMQRMMQNTNMLRADPPEHTRLRALAHDAFTPKFVQQLRGRIQSLADQLVDAVQPQGQMDLITDFAFPLPITVICEMLGAPLADAPRFHEWSSELISAGALISDHPEPVPGMMALVQYLSQLIAARRADPREDLISAMLKPNASGDQYTEMELLATSILLLIAGHETTVNLIGNGMLALLQAPDQMERLRQQPERIKDAVEELLRFVNPVQFVNRFASEDLEIDGVAIPRGSRLVLLLAAANHDAAFAPNPDQLDVTHHNARHVAFGQGIHYCLGAPLARLEGEIAFATLLARLPHLRLAIDPAAIVWRPSIVLRGLTTLPVTF